MSYDSDQYFEYSADGDKVDKRNRIISELRRQLGGVTTEEHRIRTLRDENPALQDAWDKYQSVLKLVEHA